MSPLSDFLIFEDEHAGRCLGFNNETEIFKE